MSNRQCKNFILVYFGWIWTEVYLHTHIYLQSGREMEKVSFFRINWENNKYKYNQNTLGKKWIVFRNFIWFCLVNFNCIRISICWKLATFWTRHIYQVYWHSVTERGGIFRFEFLPSRVGLDWTQVVTFLKIDFPKYIRRLSEIFGKKSVREIFSKKSAKCDFFKSKMCATFMHGNERQCGCMLYVCQFQIIIQFFSRIIAKIWSTHIWAYTHKHTFNWIKISYWSCVQSSNSRVLLVFICHALTISLTFVKIISMTTKKFMSNTWICN